MALCAYREVTIQIHNGDCIRARNVEGFTFLLTYYSLHHSLSYDTDIALTNY